MKRIVAIGSVLAMLSGCSMIGKLTGGVSLGDAAKSTDKVDKAPAALKDQGNPTSSVGAGPRVKASKDDPVAVKNAIRDLDDAEKMLDRGAMDFYAAKADALNYSFYYEKSVDEFDKADALKKRLRAIESRAIAMTDSAIAKHYGDGARVTTHAGDNAVEAMNKALDLCRQTADSRGTSTLDKDVAKYQKALKRALKVDKNIIRYVGPWQGGHKDVPSRLIACEVVIANKRLNVDDEYQPEYADGKTELGCGRLVFMVDGVQLRGRKFAPYGRTVGGATVPEPIKCSKIPRKSKAGKEFNRAIAEFKQHSEIKGLVVAKLGKPYIKSDDDDLRLHRYQEFYAYSKKMSFAANPCGKNKKLFCEAGGSRTAKMFNEMQHHATRADVHAGLRPDRCKQHLKEAFEISEKFTEFHESAVSGGDWIKGATYKTKSGEKLAEKELISRFESEGQEADDRSLGDYCSKRAQTAKKKTKKRKPPTSAKKGKKGKKGKSRS